MLRNNFFRRQRCFEEGEQEAPRLPASKPFSPSTKAFYLNDDLLISKGRLEGREPLPLRERERERVGATQFVGTAGTLKRAQSIFGYKHPVLNVKIIFYILRSLFSALSRFGQLYQVQLEYKKFQYQGSHVPRTFET